MSGALTLVRRWAVDWLSSHDPSVLPDLLAEDYVLRIGSVVIRGRDDYGQAVMGQLEQFPGLVLTVHDVMGNDERAAVRFTEHGASAAHEGRVAAWGGIAMFHAEGGCLRATWAEEDYAARRRQLRSGEPYRVESPHPAPWDVAAEAPDSRAVAAVEEWLSSGVRELPAEVLVDDEAHGTQPEPVELAPGWQVDDLFSAGPRVAFHVTRHGARQVDGSTVTLRMAGMVTVHDGAVVSGRLVRDRLGAVRRPQPVA